MKEPNFEGLWKNVTDVVKEGQLKLGYAETPVRLNYPVDSLNRLLGTDLTLEELRPVLRDFCARVREDLGNLGVSVVEGRFCLTVPVQGVRFVHEKVAASPFLEEFIALMRNPHGGVEIDDVLRVFWKYSDQVCCINADDDEFNYVVYFADGDPDDYRYLIDVDLGHATYHRLTAGDYQALGYTF